MNFHFFSKQNKPAETVLFRPLTPTDDAKNIESYSSALDSALKDKDVRNVAIMGIYGAGKSSFLRTYFKRKKKVLWISLASFLGEEKHSTNSIPDKDSNSLGKWEDQKHNPEIKDEHLLEISILQQMFYAAKQTELPFSRLRRTTGISLKRYVFVLFELGLIIIGLLGTFQPPYFNNYFGISLHAMLRLNRIAIFWFSFATLMVLACFGVWEAYRTLKRVRLYRFAVKGVEMELGQRGDESILNRNIDDILYFFESTGYRIVVFEDIDRFNDVDIFTKLREINLLLNGAKQISSRKKPIRFVYALREDLFGNLMEKVKFFDFIVPIVPIVNTSNSRDVLMSFLVELYSKNGNKEQGQKKANAFYNIVRDISPFLSDMRLVANICNEFAVYKYAIPDGVDPIKLFGMIVFKNFFPIDFAKLHSNQGILVDLIKSKNEILSELRQTIENKIAAKRAQIEAVQKESETEVDKLCLPYLGAFLATLPNQTEYLQTSEGHPRLPMFAQDRKLFNALRSKSVTSPYGYGHTIDWKQIENMVDSKRTYEERLSLIKQKTSGVIETLHDEINELQKESSHYWSTSLYTLAHEGKMTADDIHNRFSLDSRAAMLLYVLVAEGYIDEQYSLYISVFHETPGKRTSLDYRFEIDAIQGRETPWDAELPHPETVFENLGRIPFSSQAVFNFSLFEVALRDDGEKTDIWLNRLAKGNGKARRFVGEFLSRSRLSFAEKKHLYLELERINPKYAEEVVTDFVKSACNKQVADPIVGLFLRCRYDGNNNQIPDAVQTFFEKEPGAGEVVAFLGMKEKNEFKAFLEWSGIEFEDLTDNTLRIHEHFFDAIVETGSFRLSAKNLQTIFSLRSVDESGFRTRNYQTVKNCGIKSVVDLVDRNFETYLADVYEQLVAQMDSKEIVVAIMNREDLTQEEKRRYLAKQVLAFKVENQEIFVSSEALELALEFNLVGPSWRNVVAAYDRLEGNDKLLRFALSPTNQKSLISVPCSMPWEELRTIAKSFAELKDVSEEELSSLLDQLPKGKIDGFSGISATPDRIRLLFKKHRISFSPELYMRLKDNENTSHTVLAALEYAEMDKAIGDGLLSVSNEELEGILQSSDLSKRNGVAAINRFADQILTSDDLCFIAAKLISEENYQKLPSPVLSRCMTYIEDLPLKCNIVMLLGGDADSIRNLLSKFREPISRLAHPGSNIAVPTGFSQTFVDFLVDNGIVSSVTIEDGVRRIYTKRS